jgi:hypothetical protein
MISKQLPADWQTPKCSDESLTARYHSSILLNLNSHLVSFRSVLLLQDQECHALSSFKRFEVSALLPLAAKNSSVAKTIDA